ncbi:MAG: response regulator [Legionellales bacterium]|nr:response regulator [Legionellales bacterium]
MITVMLVDEQDFVRLGLLKILSDAQGIKVLGHTRSYDEAARLVRQLNPQVILLDIHLPGLTGLDVLRKILRGDNESKIIALTHEADGAIPKMAFQAGASGLLTKQASVDEVLRAVRVVHSGQRYLSASLAQHFAFNHFETPASSPFDLLSEREMQVAIMIVNDQKPLQIAYKLSLSPKTVNGCRYRIYEKLKINSDVQLTKLAIIYRLITIEPIVDKVNED